MSNEQQHKQEKDNFTKHIIKLFDIIDNVSFENRVLTNQETIEGMNTLRDMKLQIEKMVYFKHLSKSIRRKSSQPVKTELQKIQSNDYECCGNCGKIIKSSYLAQHKETPICVNRKQAIKNAVLKKKTGMIDFSGKCIAMNEFFIKREIEWNFIKIYVNNNEDLLYYTNKTNMWEYAMNFRPE